MAYQATLSDPGAWTPSDLEHSKSWDLTISPAERDDLLRALQAVNDQGLRLESISAETFPLPACKSMIQRIREELARGRGFSLVHGFPVEGQSLEDIERLYWGLCAHVGVGVTQNSDSTLIHYVTEGKLRPNQGTRSVGNPGKVSMHVDLADVASLLCIRQPEDSPPSRLTSSLAIHNAFAEHHPALLERLYEGFAWDRQNEHGPEETPTTGYPVPVFSQADGTVSCRYNRSWMTKAADRLGSGFSAEEVRLLDLFDQYSAEYAFEFPFEPGDIQFVNNYTVLHGRAPHQPAQTEDTTRLLMRIWVNMDGIRQWSDENIIRHGILRHGKLGWTGPELAAGLEGRVHPRREVDGAPLVV
jgi:hypothetical protein